MYSSVQMALGFLRYWLFASNGKGHGMHSPFVFDFITKVLRGTQADDTGFQQVETVRCQLKKSSEIIQVLDLGAGSAQGMHKQRKIKDIARYAAKSPKLARLFYRIIRYYQVDQVLELGTSLGLTTRYLSMARPRKGVVTIEGAPEIAAFTRKKLLEEGYGQVDVRCGDFASVLPEVLAGMHGKKMVFFDGNHRYAPTMAYFEQVCNYAGEDDILVFDDIHWSAEMEQAWKEIKKNQQVACTIDLFFVGIVFFRKEFKEKQDFAIRF
jgi:predicted O-methyltransferase YrrM